MRDLRTQRLVLLLIVSIIAVTFLNPHMWRIYDRILGVDGNPNLLAIAEWQPLKLERSFGWHWIFLGSVLLAIGTHLLSPRGFSYGDLLLLFTFAIVACVQQRMLVWWAIVLPWVLARQWNEMIGNRGSVEVAGIRCSKSGFIAIAAIAIAGFCASPLFQWIVNGHPASLTRSLEPQVPWALGMQIQTEPDPDINAFPEIHEILAANYPDGRFHGTVMVSPRMGDFLLWRGLRVAIYSQLAWFKQGYWAEIDGLMQCPPGWWEVFDQKGVNLIALGPDDYPRLRRRIEQEPGWVVVHRPGSLADPSHARFDGWIVVRKKPILD